MRKANMTLPRRSFFVALAALLAFWRQPNVPTPGAWLRWGHKFSTRLGHDGPVGRIDDLRPLRKCDQR
jgi:hypothetical protein